MFWDLTAEEVAAVLDAQREEERRATLRAALVAATVVNVNRRQGARLVQPQEFLREAPREEDYMDAETAASVMDRWAMAQNAALAEQVGDVAQG